MVNHAPEIVEQNAFLGLTKPKGCARIGVSRSDADGIRISDKPEKECREVMKRFECAALTMILDEQGRIAELRAPGGINLIREPQDFASLAFYQLLPAFTNEWVHPLHVEEPEYGGFSSCEDTEDGFRFGRDQGVVQRRGGEKQNQRQPVYDGGCKFDAAERQTGKNDHQHQGGDGQKRAYAMRYGVEDLFSASIELGDRGEIAGEFLGFAFFRGRHRWFVRHKRTFLSRKMYDFDTVIKRTGNEN